MKIEYWNEISQIKSIVFGADKLGNNIYVYLHGSGGFRTGYEGQYEYPDFASLLRDGKIELEQPFIVACCMDREHWNAVQLIEYLNELSMRFNNARIDVIGYSRGGTGVYSLLQSSTALRSATVINSRLPIVAKPPNVPVHIIHASNDQLTQVETVREFVKQFGNELTSFTVWHGDHFSIAAIALSGIWRQTEPAI